MNCDQILSSQWNVHYILLKTAFAETSNSRIIKFTYFFLFFQLSTTKTLNIAYKTLKSKEKEAVCQGILRLEEKESDDFPGCSLNLIYLSPGAEEASNWKCQQVQASPNKNKSLLSLAKGSETGVRGDHVGTFDFYYHPAVLKYPTPSPELVQKKPSGVQGNPCCGVSGDHVRIQNVHSSFSHARNQEQAIYIRCYNIYL